MHAPWGPNYFIFMHFSEKSLQNNPTLGVGAPPPPPLQENPRSATEVAGALVMAPALVPEVFRSPPPVSAKSSKKLFLHEFRIEYLHR